MKKSNKIANFSTLVTEHPWWILLTSLIFVMAMMAGVSRLTFDNDYRAYFSDENPQLQAFDAIQATYNNSDSVLFVLQPQEGTVFTPETLSAIHELTEKSWKTPYSSRVDSLTNFQHTQAEQDDLIVSDLVSNPLLSADAIEKVKQIALSEPLLVNRLISKTGHVAGVNVILQLPDEDFNTIDDVVNYVRTLAAEIETNYPNITVYLTGMAMMNNAFNESAMYDNKVLIPIMYSIVIIALLISFRSISATFAVVILIIFSIVSALGLTGWLNWSLTPTSATAPTIILTMAVADCVHILVTQLHHMRMGHEKKQAIQESLRINFQPIFLTSLTTVIGFLSLNFSDAPPFRDLGNIVAIGILLAWLLSVTFLPAMMSILPVNVKQQGDLDNSIMNYLSEGVIRYRKPLLLINGVIALILIAFVPRNELNDEFIKYFDKTTEFRQGTDFLNDNMSGIYTIEFSIHAGGQGAISEPNYLQQVAKLTAWLLTQKEVIHVNTLTDIFKELNKNMHGDDEQWYRLPESRELAAQYLLLYEMSLPYGLDLNDQINIDKSGIRMIVTLESMSSNAFLKVEERMNQWLAENMNEYKVELASPVLMFSHIGQRNIIRMVIGSALALVLISILLTLAFKSIKLGFISLLPNLLPAGVAFGIWGLIDGRIGLGLSVVTGMTLGIVVDDTVHFISKYRRARLEKSMNSEDAVRYAFSTVGVALWITSVVLVSGFIVLSFSHFTMNSEMGLMTAITIASALILDLLFLPPLLMALDKNKQ